MSVRGIVQPGAQLGRQRRRDRDRRSAARGSPICRDGGSARSSRAAWHTPRRRPPSRRSTAIRSTQLRPCSYGKRRVSLRSSGIAARIAVWLGSLASPASWRSWAGVMFASAQSVIRSVASPSGRDSRASARSELLVSSRPELGQPEVLVLEGMVELMGVGDLLDRAELARLRHDVHRLGVRVVQPGHLARQELDVEVLERGVRGQQAERLEEPLVGGDEGRRVALVERVGDEGGELVRGQDPAGHVGLLGQLAGSAGRPSRSR